MNTQAEFGEYDVVVVGGGIAGVGILQAATAAGYDALLLERQAIACGTSSKSSKLIHGGLRYLESGQFALVRESLRERAILTTIAPGLVRLVPFFIPVYRDTTRRAWQIRAGLSLYAVLGNLAAAARFQEWPRSRWAELDGLRTDGLQRVFRYFDGQTDDAELTRAVLRSAEDLGGRSIVGAELQRAVRRGDQWHVTWRREGRAENCTARTLVNAAGPWVEQVRERVDPRPPGMSIELVQGAHVELAGELAAGIYYAEAPRDRRAVFAMPWKGRTLVGTTETPTSVDPARIHALDEEVEYLVATYAHYFPGRPIEEVARWAGARVLPRTSGAAFDRPREVTLLGDSTRPPRFVGVYGGKLTGYRATASKVIAMLAPALGPRRMRGDTRTLPLRPDHSPASAPSSALTNAR